ncbi:MlaD family protein [Uliginosibacterium sp. 31-12]|uniref:MlaD family protein n=1 Tax=Uliginosibacterium sp. 31-12 TaxID=3062781 RepID=UPI0026E240FD|nr:MlaD family protein [Uliginosibacterium sp. 31-12]MDO6386277.1 MlaD family protein [Uliginosibacterium sp. 31-12]
MSQRSSPALIGAFVFGAMVLIVVGIFLFTGHDFFTRKPRYVMYFEGSVYGLQIGAPVVFRGVQIGSVQRIDLRYDAGHDQLVVPVVMEGIPRKVLDVDGDAADELLPNIDEMVNRGLRARLASQSMLTGQLYIDLDLLPDKPLVYRAPTKRLPEIPTVVSPVQEIAQKLQQVDLESLLKDMAAIVESARDFVRSPELRTSLAKVDASLGAMQGVSQQLEQRIGPLADKLDKSLDSIVLNMDKMGIASDGLASMSAQSAAPMESLTQAADELRRTAATLSELAGMGGPALHEAGQTLRELRGTAQSLQELSDTLERQPNALLFGRSPAARKEPK